LSSINSRRRGGPDRHEHGVVTPLRPISQHGSQRRRVCVARARRESNPGRINGNNVFYHSTVDALTILCKLPLAVLITRSASALRPHPCRALAENDESGNYLTARGRAAFCANRRSLFSLFFVFRGFVYRELAATSLSCGSWEKGKTLSAAMRASPRSAL